MVRERAQLGHGDGCLATRRVVVYALHHEPWGRYHSATISAFFHLPVCGGGSLGAVFSDDRSDVSATPHQPTLWYVYLSSHHRSNCTTITITLFCHTYKKNDGFI